MPSDLIDEGERERGGGRGRGGEKSVPLIASRGY